MALIAAGVLGLSRLGFAESPRAVHSAPAVIDFFWRLLLYVAYRGQLAYWFVCRPSEESAHVAVWWKGRILTVRNTYRHLTVMPAGGVKRGETPAEAACRELREEVGIALSIEQLHPAGVFISRQQYKEDRAHVFEIDLESEPDIVVDGREVASAEFADPNALPPEPCCEVLQAYLARR